MGNLQFGLETRLRHYEMNGPRPSRRLKHLHETSGVGAQRRFLALGAVLLAALGCGVAAFAIVLMAH